MYERKNKRRPLPIVNKTFKQGKEDVVLKKKKIGSVGAWR